MIPPNPIDSEDAQGPVLEPKSEASIPRKRRLPIISALLVSMVVGVTVGAFVGVHRERARWTPRYNQGGIHRWGSRYVYLQRELPFDRPSGGANHVASRLRVLGDQELCV